MGKPEYPTGPKKSQHKQLEEVFSAVGLQDSQRRMTNTLSGGQLQARVLIREQPVLTLDETFKTIDTKTLIDLTRLVKQCDLSRRTLMPV